MRKPGRDAMKGKVLLVHWNSQEAGILADMVRSYGWEVATETDDGSRVGRQVKEMKPNAVVIYLSRQPSHGRETGQGLRSLKTAKTVPLVYVDGTPEVVERTRQKIPDAIFTSTEELPEVLVKFAQFT
jgi:DNA-binding response OmpR family regulator